MAYAAILVAQLYMYHNKIYNSMWPKYFANVSASDIKFIIYGANRLCCYLCRGDIKQSLAKSKFIDGRDYFAGSDSND